jgi:hypothetical protein
MRLAFALLALGFWSASAIADPRDRDYQEREVRDIQERLIELGYAKDGRFQVDGDYGDKTRDVIRNFQRDRNLRPTDGEAGPDTLAALFGTGEDKADNPQPGANFRCKSEEISSTGDARPMEGWAMRLAKKNWKEEVRARFGEEWSDYAKAKVSLTKCFEASVGGIPLKRCRIQATPCNPS